MDTTASGDRKDSIRARARYRIDNALTKGTAPVIPAPWVATRDGLFGLRRSL